MACRLYQQKEDAIREEIQKPLELRQFAGETAPDWLVEGMAEELLSQSIGDMWWCRLSADTTEFWETFEFFWVDED